MTGISPMVRGYAATAHSTVHAGEVHHDPDLSPRLLALAGKGNAQPVLAQVVPYILTNPQKPTAMRYLHAMVGNTHDVSVQTVAMLTAGALNIDKHEKHGLLQELREKATFATAQGTALNVLDGIRH